MRNNKDAGGGDSGNTGVVDTAGVGEGRGAGGRDNSDGKARDARDSASGAGDGGPRVTPWE